MKLRPDKIWCTYIVHFQDILVFIYTLNMNDTQCMVKINICYWKTGKACVYV